MEPTEENVRAWDRRYARSEEPRGLPPVVVDRLPDLSGRHVLHLGAGSGEGTIELAQRGALVTAVESDPALVAAAREREPAAS
jgi:trans-aconitate methyltransferase